MAVVIANTASLTSNGLVLVFKGVNIGAVSKYTINEGQDMQAVWELGSITKGGGADIIHDTGEPFEHVPGNSTGFKIGFTRGDLYTARLNQVFGLNGVAMLSQQTTSFQVYEVSTAPDNTNNYTRVFYGCYLSKADYTVEANGAKAIQVSGEITYSRYRFL
jgi:hypothetical protein